MTHSSRDRDPFQAARVGAALAGQALSSVTVRLGRAKGGPKGALVRKIGKQDEIQHLYKRLISLLAKRGIVPRHRKSGLKPHVTLGYAPSRVEPFDIAVEWLARELLLIESEVSNGRHHVVGRWPLLAPAQGTLPFEPQKGTMAANRLIG